MCGRCGAETAWKPRAEPLEECGFCGCTSLYLEKDFPARIGCVVMLAAIAAFLITERILVLVGAAAVDLGLFYLLRDRVICYRCLAEYRHIAPDPKFTRYDLTTAARYADWR